jgi:bifunctional non-homologous end joining protein LigD
MNTAQRRRPRASLLIAEVAALPPAAAVPDFVEPQLCKLAQAIPADEGAIYEPKIDGFRLQLYKHAGRVRLFTREKQDWTHKFPHIVAAAAVLPDCTLDGEVAAFDAQDRSDINLLREALSAGKTADLVFVVFDILFLRDVRDEAAGVRDLRSVTLAVRKAQLTRLFTLYRPPLQIRLIKYTTTLRPQLTRALRMELEGVVRKRLNATYVSGSRDSWIKIRNRRKECVFIGGWIGTRQEVRALLIGVPQGKKLRYMGCVRHGFQKRQQNLLALLATHARLTHPFTVRGVLPDPVEVHWVRPLLQIEVESAAQIAKRPLRDPMFLQLLPPAA